MKAMHFCICLAEMSTQRTTWNESGLKIHPFILSCVCPCWCWAVGGAKAVTDSSCIVHLLPSVFTRLRCFIWRCSAHSFLPSPIPFSLSLTAHTHTHRVHAHTLGLSFLPISLCILHLYSLSSRLTEVGKLPSGGASSRCSLFLSSLHLCLSLPPSRSLSLSSLSRGAYSALSVPVVFFFFLAHSFTVSQRWQLREAAVYASALKLPPVKTAALLDFFNPTGGGGVCVTALLQVPILERSSHFQASPRKHPGGKDSQRILATRPTNHGRKGAQAFMDWRERTLSETLTGIFSNIVACSRIFFFSFFFYFPTASCFLRTVSVSASTSAPLAPVVLFFCGGMYSLNRWGKAVGPLAAVSKDSTSRQEDTEWTAWGNLIHNRLVKELDHVAVADLSTLWYLCSTTPLCLLFFSVFWLNIIRII